MANNYFDRYSSFRDNGKISPIPGIYLNEKSTDKKIIYRLGVTRLDKVSQTYYGNPYHGWLIMSANPNLGGLEFNIPDGTIIIIPFPFNDSLEQYQNEMLKQIKLNGR